MTADNHSQIEKIPHPSLFQTLTLVFAGLTLCFAVFSIIVGNRLSTIRTDRLNALKETKSLGPTSIEEMQTALDHAQANLEAAKQDAAEEKKNTEKMHQKLSTTQKELEKIKADLATANQSLAEFKATLPAEPTTTTSTSQPASPQEPLPPPQKTTPTSDQPTTPVQPAQKQPETTPENQLPKPSPPVTENNTGGSPPPTAVVGKKPAQTMSPTAEDAGSDATPPSSPLPAATE